MLYIVDNRHLYQSENSINDENEYKLDDINSKLVSKKIINESSKCKKHIY